MITYFAIAYALWVADAMACVVAKKPFNVWGSAVALLFWPITGIFVLVGAAQQSKTEQDGSA